MPISGNRWLVGVVFLIHITVVAFIIGVAMMAPVAEIMGTRLQDERWERFAHQVALAIERLFAWGATWAAFALVGIWALFPVLWGYLVSLFFIQIIIIAGLLWFVMTAAAYLYYLTWEGLRYRRKLHNAIGWAFVLSTMLFINTITNLDSYQLTPAGGPNDLLAAAINPSYLGEFPHRHIGNLSYGGLVLAAYLGGWFLLFRRRRRRIVSESERIYHDWLMDTALLVGLIVLLLQPASGAFYSHQIMVGSYGAWVNMMPGENGWLFRIQIGLLGAIFFVGNLYMLLALARGEPRPRTALWMRISLVLVGLSIGLAVLPKDVPGGQMVPWKFLALGIFVVVTLANLVLYFLARRTFRWGTSGRLARVSLSAIGVLVIAIFVIMGIIRESARGPWLIYDKMGPDQSQELIRP